MHQIPVPENGFSHEVKRLIQAGVLVHEFAHSIVNQEIWGQPADYSLMFPNGKRVPFRPWIGAFARAAEELPPISRYSSAYRNKDNKFPREGEAMVLGMPIAEELVESITAAILGFIVTPDGELTFEPFKHREEIHEATKAYLAARTITE
jgi:hypothetical protein